MSDCFILFIVSLVSVQIEQVLGHSKANMAYFQVYLSQGDTCTCHCATSQIVQNSQTSRQFLSDCSVAKAWLSLSWLLKLQLFVALVTLYKAKLCVS